MYRHCASDSLRTGMFHAHKQSDVVRSLQGITPNLVLSIQASPNIIKMPLTSEKSPLEITMRYADGSQRSLPDLTDLTGPRITKPELEKALVYGIECTVELVGHTKGELDPIQCAFAEEICAVLQGVHQG